MIWKIKDWVGDRTWRLRHLWSYGHIAFEREVHAGYLEYPTARCGTCLKKSNEGTEMAVE